MEYINFLYLLISECVLNECFLNVQLNLRDFEIKTKRNKYECGRSFLEFLRKSHIFPRLKEYKRNKSNCTCS